MSSCGFCSRPTGDGATLCGDDTDALLADLAAVAGLVTELHATLARQDRVGAVEHSTSRSAERPLPWNQRAAGRLRNLRTVLLSAVAELGDPTTLQAPRLYPAHDPHDPARIGDRMDAATYAARALTANIARLRQLPDAGHLFDAIRGAVRAARRAVDRPADSRFIGTCSATTPDGDQCQADLYVHPSRRVAVCPACETPHDVDARRDVLRTAVHDQLVTPHEASRALPFLVGRAVKTSTIKNWVSRRVLIPEGYRHHGSYSPTKLGYHDPPLLLVADIIAEYTRVARDEASTRAA